MSNIDNEVLIEQLMDAIYEGDVDESKRLIMEIKEKKLNLNYTIDEGVTALMKAASQGGIDIVKELIAEGAGVNLLNDYGETALIYAASMYHAAIIKELVDAGADTTNVDKWVRDDRVKNLIKYYETESKNKTSGDCNNTTMTDLTEVGEIENIIYYPEGELTWCFDFAEVEHLLQTKLNPYNRQPLSPYFIDHLGVVQDSESYKEWKQTEETPPPPTLNQLVASIVERRPYFLVDQFLALNRPQLYDLARQLAQRGIITLPQLTDWNDSLELEEFKRKIIEHVIDTNKERFFDNAMYSYLETEEPELPDPQLEQTQRLIGQLEENLEANPDNIVIQQQLERLRRREESLLIPPPEIITQIFPPPLSPPLSPPLVGGGRFRTMEPQALTFTTAPSVPTNEEYDGEVEDYNNVIQNYIRDSDAEGLREYFQEPNLGLRGEEVYAIEHSASKEVLRVLVDEMIANREGGVNLRMFQIAVEESLDNMLGNLIEAIDESQGGSNELIQGIFQKFSDDDQDLLQLAIDTVDEDTPHYEVALNTLSVLLDEGHHPITQDYIRYARNPSYIIPEVINILEETYDEQQE